MASDRKQFRDAADKWEELYNERRFSLAPDIGITAIMYAVATAGDTDDARENERINFEDEAHDIADVLMSQKRRTEVMRGITQSAFYNEVLARHEVASVILIGHGNFSNVISDHSSVIDWRDVSYISTHLKRGIFEQRFCGHYMRDLSVPLGLFAVSDPRRIYAAKGTQFAPERNPNDEKLMRPITSKSRLHYGDIKALFPLDHAYKERLAAQNITSPSE
jgi:hypothetical protein